MPKFLLRIVAVLLAPCLAFSQVEGMALQAETGRTLHFFCDQALAAPATNGTKILKHQRSIGGLVTERSKPSKHWRHNFGISLGWHGYQDWKDTLEDAYESLGTALGTDTGLRSTRDYWNVSTTRPQQQWFYEEPVLRKEKPRLIPAMPIRPVLAIRPRQSLNAISPLTPAFVQEIRKILESYNGVYITPRLIQKELDQKVSRADILLACHLLGKDSGSTHVFRKRGELDGNIAFRYNLPSETMVEEGRKLAAAIYGPAAVRHFEQYQERFSGMPETEIAAQYVEGLFDELNEAYGYLRESDTPLSTDALFNRLSQTSLLIIHVDEFQRGMEWLLNNGYPLRLNEQGWYLSGLAKELGVIEIAAWPVRTRAHWTSIIGQSSLAVIESRAQDYLEAFELDRETDLNQTPAMQQTMNAWKTRPNEFQKLRASTRRKNFPLVEELAAKMGYELSVLVEGRYNPQLTTLDSPAESTAEIEEPNVIEEDPLVIESDEELFKRLAERTMHVGKNLKQLFQDAKPNLVRAYCRIIESMIAEPGLFSLIEVYCEWRPTPENDVLKPEWIYDIGLRCVDEIFRYAPSWKRASRFVEPLVHQVLGQIKSVPNGAYRVSADLSYGVLSTIARSSWIRSLTPTDALRGQIKEPLIQFISGWHNKAWEAWRDFENGNRFHAMIAALGSFGEDPRVKRLLEAIEQRDHRQSIRVAVHRALSAMEEPGLSPQVPAVTTPPITPVAEKIQEDPGAVELGTALFSNTVTALKERGFEGHPENMQWVMRSADKAYQLALWWNEFRIHSPYNSGAEKHRLYFWLGLQPDKIDFHILGTEVDAWSGRGFESLETGHVNLDAPARLGVSVNGSIVVVLPKYILDAGLTTSHYPKKTISLADMQKRFGLPFRMLSAQQAGKLTDMHWISEKPEPANNTDLRVQLLRDPVMNLLAELTGLSRAEIVERGILTGITANDFQDGSLRMQKVSDFISCALMSSIMSIDSSWSMFDLIFTRGKDSPPVRARFKENQTIWTVETVPLPQYKEPGFRPEGWVLRNKWRGDQYKDGPLLIKNPQTTVEPERKISSRWAAKMARMAIGGRLRQWRRECPHLNTHLKFLIALQKKFSMGIPLTANRIQRYEDGSFRSIPDEVARMFEEFFGKNPGELLGRAA